MVNKKSGSRPEKVKMSYLFELAGIKKGVLYTAILFSVLSGLSTFVPYVMVFRTMMILFLDNKNVDTVIQYGLTAGVFILLKFIFLALSAGMVHICAYNVLYHARKKICSHIGKVNLGFFTDNSTGEIKKVLMEDVERLEKFLAHQIPDITVAVVVPVAVLIYMLTINVPMALILLLPIIATLFLQYIMIVITKPMMTNFPGILGKLNSSILQFVNGMPVMKTYNLTANSYRAYSETCMEYNDLWVSVAKIASPISAACKVLIESGIFFTLPFVGWLYLSGHLELEAYIFFVIMSIVFLAAYNNLMNFAQIFSQISSGLERIKSVMDISEMPSGTDEITGSEHTVTFNQVTFAYQKKDVLCDVNLMLPKGSLTAFVGSSGAGKSTAAQLIPRFWDITGGSICIDNKDIRKIKNENLMELVSFVFQDAFMLEDTVYQNIAIGKPNCTEQEVEAAAKAAQINDFILKLPNGYDTRIGAAGVKMSGGEKQRICIARAILKNSPIIIFDEATSFTDIENEHKIQIALGNLLKNKTTVMIAHRLHTIVNANQICVFEKGQIKETGTHQQLLERNGLYADMWSVYTEQGKGVLA